MKSKGKVCYIVVDGCMFSDPGFYYLLLELVMALLKYIILN